MIYRVTWRHEVVFEAKDDAEAKAKWPGIQTGYLAELGQRGEIMSHAFVEIKSFECLSEDYREVQL